MCEGAYVNVHVVYAYFLFEEWFWQLLLKGLSHKFQQYYHFAII